MKTRGGAIRDSTHPVKGSMNTPLIKHTSYILRIWNSAQGGQYRYTLQNVMSGESWHFSNLNALYYFLASTDREVIPETVAVLSEQEI